MYNQINQQNLFKKINNDLGDCFQLKYSTSSNSWSVFLDADKKIIYSLNDTKDNSKISPLAEAIMGDLKALFKQNNNSKQSKMETNGNEYIHYLIDELTKHEVEFKGKKYYLIEHKIISEIKKDVQEFYGKEAGLEKTLNPENYPKFFSYGCLINAENNKYEVLFNTLFAKYDSEKTSLSIKPLDEVMAEEEKKSNTPKFFWNLPHRPIIRKNLTITI